MSEMQAAIVRVVFGLLAIAVGLLALTTTPVFALSRDFAVGLIVAGFAVGGVNLIGTITGAREAARVRETQRAELTARIDRERAAARPHATTPPRR